MANIFSQRTSAAVLAAAGLTAGLTGCAKDPQAPVPLVPVSAPAVPGNVVGSFETKWDGTKAVSIVDLGDTKLLMVGEAVIEHRPAAGRESKDPAIKVTEVDGGGTIRGADQPSFAKHWLVEVEGQRYLYWHDYGFKSDVEKLINVGPAK